MLTIFSVCSLLVDYLSLVRVYGLPGLISRQFHIVTRFCKKLHHFSANLTLSQRAFLHCTDFLCCACFVR